MRGSWGWPLSRAMVLCLLVSAWQAARPAIAARSPGALLADFVQSPSQVARERQGSVTVRVEGSDQPLKTILAQTVVDAPAPVVWTVLTDFPDYPKLFPRKARSQLRTVGGEKEQ